MQKAQGVSRKAAKEERRKERENYNYSLSL
jgi:hypothetical protein